MHWSLLKPVFFYFSLSLLFPVQHDFPLGPMLEMRPLAWAHFFFIISITHLFFRSLSFSSSPPSCSESEGGRAFGAGRKEDTLYRQSVSHAGSHANSLPSHLEYTTSTTSTTFMRI